METNQTIKFSFILNDFMWRLIDERPETKAMEQRRIDFLVVNCKLTACWIYQNKKKQNNFRVCMQHYNRHSRIFCRNIEIFIFKLYVSMCVLGAGLAHDAYEYDEWQFVAKSQNNSSYSAAAARRCGIWTIKKKKRKTTTTGDGWEMFTLFWNCKRRTFMLMNSIDHYGFGWQKAPKTKFMCCCCCYCRCCHCCTWIFGGAMDAITKPTSHHCVVAKFRYAIRWCLMFDVCRHQLLPAWLWSLSSNFNNRWLCTL